MGWGTDFIAEIFLSHQTFLGKYDVESKIIEIEEKIKENESKIKMFAIANPKDIIPEEWKEEPISWLHEETQTELDSYYENIIELNHLTLYLKYLNSVNDNKTVKDLIYDLKFTLSGKQTQFTNGLLTEEEYIKQCDDATNSIIIRIKDKLNEEQKRISE